MTTLLGAWNLLAGLLLLLAALPLYRRGQLRGVPCLTPASRHQRRLFIHAGRRLVQLAPVLLVIGLYALLVPFELTVALVWTFALAPLLVLGLVLIDVLLTAQRWR